MSERMKAHKPELVVLWGASTHDLTVGFTRAVGWEAVGNATPDGMYARFDCPSDWVQRLAATFLDLRSGIEEDMAHFATHELVPPRMQAIRRIGDGNE